MIEKTKNLETERKNLLIEIEKLKKTVDTKATTLEKKIAELHEVKSLKIFLGKNNRAQTN